MDPQAAGAQQAVDTSRNVANAAYGVGIPALRAQQDEINRGLRTGESPVMKDAFNQQRTGLTESIFQQGSAAQGQFDLGMNPVVQGGNSASILHPFQIGSKLADAVMSSHTNEAMGNIQQTNKLLADAIGMGSTAANSSVAAGAAQLQGVAGMPSYDPTYAAILGTGNALGAVWGQGKQSNWWGGGGGDVHASGGTVDLTTR